MSKTNSKKRGVVSVCLAALLSASAWHVADVEARDDNRSLGESERHRLD